MSGLLTLLMWPPYLAYTKGLEVLLDTGRGGMLVTDPVCPRSNAESDCPGAVDACGVEEG